MAKSMRYRINVEALGGRLALSAVAGVAPMVAAEISAVKAKKAVTGKLKGTVMNEGGRFLSL
jgi:hypothetical protein